MAFDHKKAVDPAKQTMSVNTKPFFLLFCVTVFSLRVAGGGEEVLIWTNIDTGFYLSSDVNRLEPPPPLLFQNPQLN